MLKQSTDVTAVDVDFAGAGAAGIERLHTVPAPAESTVRSQPAFSPATDSLDSAGSGIVMLDATQAANPVIFANSAFFRMTGHAPDQVIGRSFFLLQNGDADQPGLADIRTAIANKEEGRAVLHHSREDGAVFWSELAVSPVPDEAGTVTHFIVVQTDITTKKNHAEQLAFQAAHDELTGLPNRYLLKTGLQNALQQARQDDSAVALLFLDIDHFKLVNNSLDHVAGDLLIKSIGERLGHCIGEGDLLSRQGEDEFAIVLRGIGKSRSVAAVCEDIARAVAAPFLLQEGKSIHVTCSIGIALYPQDGDDAVMLFKYADMALSRAKDLGRNNSQFFSHEMNERTLEQVTLKSALHAAILSDQLRLYYQPLLDLQTGKIIGLEALVRWEHPELGIIAPERFISIAEESGLILDIGAWVLRKACTDLRAWIDHGVPDLMISINLTPKQFRAPMLADKIGAMLSEMGIEPHMLSLEVTESVVIQDASSSQATLQQLKTQGIDLVLDDFGTGYSSLSYLKRFPFNKVKIDRAFVQNIVTDVDEAAVAKAIISMAHSLGIRVVAEGVETEAQCEFLRRHQCDEIQGFLFSEALPANGIEDILREGRCLPAHLLRQQRPSRTLLLVDDEQNILAALKRLLRRDGYHIITAGSGLEGLELLAQNDVDVIISDQRMPGMTGVEFLRRVKDMYPDTVRIVLSGYTELQSVTDAVNEGAIYKFLTKPWDDLQLGGHVEEAFRRKEMADENRRLNLEVKAANQELAEANRQLEEVLKQKQQQIARDEISLGIVREVLQNVPLPVIGLDDDDLVAFVNTAAQTLFSEFGLILGSDAKLLMPELFHALDSAGEGEQCFAELNGTLFQVISHTMGKGSQSRGRLMTLTKYEVEP